jgi:hypothetical protein
MLKIVGIAVALLVVAILAALALAATKADTFAVRRRASIKAAPDAIFPLIADFRNWTAWSPWEKRDPNLKRTYGGAPSGTGATYAWEGNRNVGSGRMEIVDAAPPGKIIIKLDFIIPFEGHNVAEFTLTPQGEATDVNWEMRGPVPFIGKIMHVFINMDRMIGTDFEAGLAAMKAAAEKPR